MVTTRPPKTIVKPTALGPVANTDTKLLIYGLFQKGRVLAQDGIDPNWNIELRIYHNCFAKIRMEPALLMRRGIAQYEIDLEERMWKEAEG